MSYKKMKFGRMSHKENFGEITIKLLPWFRRRSGLKPKTDGRWTNGEHCYSPSFYLSNFKFLRSCLASKSDVNSSNTY